MCFLGGILLVFLKWPFIGFIVEIFGFLNLFGYVMSLVVPVKLMAELVVQGFLSGNLDLPATATVHWDILDASVCPRRTWTVSAAFDPSFG